MDLEVLFDLFVILSSESVERHGFRCEEAPVRGTAVQAYGDDEENEFNNCYDDDEREKLDAWAAEISYRLKVILFARCGFLAVSPEVIDAVPLEFSLVDFLEVLGTRPLVDASCYVRTAFMFRILIAKPLSDVAEKLV